MRTGDDWQLMGQRFGKWPCRGIHDAFLVGAPITSVGVFSPLGPRALFARIDDCSAKVLFETVTGRVFQVIRRNAGLAASALHWSTVASSCSSARLLRIDVGFAPTFEELNLQFLAIFLPREVLSYKKPLLSRRGERISVDLQLFCRCFSLARDDLALSESAEAGSIDRGDMNRSLCALSRAARTDATP